MKGEWPEGIAWIDDPRDAKEACDKMREAHSRMWARYETLQTLYRDHFPDIWQRLRNCRQTVKEIPLETHQGRHRMLQLESCKERPYCPACNDAWRSMRARRAAKTFEAATPQKETILAYGWTIAAREHTQNHEWHHRAMNNHRAFMRGAAKGLQRIYQGPIGLYITFQAYGEKLFVENHPHLHIIVNGWAIRDGKPIALQPPHLTKGGNEAFTAPLREEIGKALKTDVPFTSQNTHISKPSRGLYAIHGSFRYNFRELIDPLKFEYNRTQQKIEITNYRDPIDRATIDAPTLRPRILAYAIKYGDYTDIGRTGPAKGRRPVDGWYGDLSDRQLNNTIIAMDGGRRHGPNCKCHACAEWGRPQPRNDITYGTLEEEARPW